MRWHLFKILKDLTYEEVFIQIINVIYIVLHCAIVKLVIYEGNHNIQEFVYELEEYLRKKHLSLFQV